MRSRDLNRSIEGAYPSPFAWRRGRHFQLADLSAQRGQTLVELIMTVALLAVAALTYTQLQAGASGSGVDSRLISVASHLAEATIDTQRHFTRLEAEPDSVMPAYEEIVDGEVDTTMAGVEFMIVQQVDDYYWDRASGRFSTTAPARAAHSDFKRLAVTVSWDDPRGYAIDVAQQSDANPGSGSITLSTIILSSSRAAQRLAIRVD
jgi:prepilin-type N-terminal cleavage/methylation domain-containing protein